MMTSGLDTNSTTSLLLARSDSVQIDTSLVPSLVAQIVTAQYFNVALITLTIYHSILAFHKEVKYFWSSPCNTISLIYFTNRLIGVLGAVMVILLDSFTASITRCAFSYWTREICNWLNIVLIDYILIIRVLALYHQDRRLSISLKTILGLDAAAGLGLLIYDNLFEGTVVGDLTGGTSICGQPRGVPKSLSIASWTIPLSVGMLLLCLALYKAAEYWKLSSGFKGFHLVRVLIEDQLLYYGFIIFNCVLQIAVDSGLIQTKPFIAELLNAIGSPTLLCIMGGQLLINLKEAGERGANGGTNYRSQSVSDIQFA